MYMHSRIYTGVVYMNIDIERLRVVMTFSIFHIYSVYKTYLGVWRARIAINGSAIESRDVELFRNPKIIQKSIGARRTIHFSFVAL